MTENYLEELKAIVIDSLKDTVESQESFMPRIHLLKEKEEKVIFLPFGNDEEKREILLAVGAVAYEENCHQLVFISDTYVRKMNTEAQAKEVAENWETEQPSTYPDSLRSEAIIMLAVDFKSSKNEKMYVILYKKEGNRVVDIDESTMPSEVIGGAIKRYLSDGFCRAKIIDVLQRKELTIDQLSSVSRSKLHELLSEVSDEIKQDYPNIKPMIDS
jgi:hypothetical protein